MQRRLVKGITRLGLLAPVALALGLAGGPARALSIVNTGSISDSAVLGAINTAINTVNSLYSNAVTLDVNFTYTSASSLGYPGFLGASSQNFGQVSYGDYVNALTNISAANPTNTYLSTAVSHFSEGNDANGAAKWSSPTARRQCLASLRIRIAISRPSTLTVTSRTGDSRGRWEQVNMTWSA